MFFENTNRWNIFELKYLNAPSCNLKQTEQLMSAKQKLTLSLPLIMSLANFF